MCVYCVENVLTALTYIALNTLEIWITLIVSTNIVFDGMVGKSWVSAFQLFFRIENQLNMKKVMGSNVCMCFVWTVLTYIALNALEILIVSTVLTNVVFDGMVEKSWVSAFQNAFRIEIQLNIKKVMDRNVCMCSVSTVLTYIAFKAICALISCVDSVNIHNALLALIFYTVYRPCWHTPYTAYTTHMLCLLWSFVQCIDCLDMRIKKPVCPLMYTQQIRWQCVASSLSNLK